jgi:DNA-binding CsgD family transcriptional regulator
MTDDPSTSARALRSQLRESARETSRLRLLEAACLAAADERQPQSALRLALAHAQGFLAADTAAALRLESGGLTVQAAQGLALPPGARVAATGALGTALGLPILVRERTVSPLRMVGREAAAVEVLLPLRYRGQVGGLLALSSGHPIAPPDADDTVTLQAFAAILAGIVEEPRAPRASRAPRREAIALIASLTAREQQVLSLLPRGLSNAELAQQLGIAPGTVKVHIERILHKLGVRDRTQAAVRATEWGLGK